MNNQDTRKESRRAMQSVWPLLSGGSRQKDEENI